MKSTQSTNLTRLQVLLGFTVVLAQSSQAANLTLGTTDPGGTSSITNPLTGAATGWGPSKLAPTAGNTYEVLAGAIAVRSPNNGGTYTFPGDSLTINGSGGRFLLKATGTTGVINVNNLILNGGTVDEANSSGDGASVTLAGNISVTAPSFIGALSGETLIVSSKISGANALQIGTTGDAGNVILTGTSSSYTGNVTVANGALQFGNNGTTGSLSSSSNIINNTATRFARTNIVTQGTDFGVISGTGSLSQTGTGDLILNAANTFTGGVSIFTGGSITASSLNSVVGGTSSSSLGAPTTIANGTITMGGNGAAGILIYVGTGETTDRAIRLSAFSSGSNGVIDQSGAGLLNFTGGITNAAGSAHVITLQGSTAGTGEISGAITEANAASALALTKAGTGTWTLSGTNTYTGKTTISGGSLALAATGSIVNSSEISINGGNFNVSAVTGFAVEAGQSLTGSGGSVTGDITVNGTLAIGNSPGTMTFNNDLTVGSSAIANFEFTDPTFALGSYDSALGGAGTQTVTFGGTLNLLFSGGTYANETSVQIFDFEGYTGTFPTVNFSGLEPSQSAVFNATTGFVTVVPEPGAALLSCLGGVMLLRRRRA